MIVAFFLAEIYGFGRRQRDLPTSAGKTTSEDLPEQRMSWAK